jgi:hypothetical protein
VGGLETPGQFLRDGVPRIGDFYDATNVAKATENLLLLLRPDGMRFFDWLGSRRVDQSSYRLSLQALVTLRNDVAHQLGLGLKTTAPELALHQKRLTLLARGMRAYTRGDPPGSGALSRATAVATEGAGASSLPNGPVDASAERTD